ncbi:MAG: hypothetical protein ACPG77_21320, partial [Nannocystaceae bacterium]
MTLVRTALLLTTLTLAATSCAHETTLVAVDGSHRMVARDPNTGLSVVLTTDAWDGEPAMLEQELTVFHVVVANMGQQPVRLAPGDLDLVDRRGFRYRLLDAGGSFQVSGSNLPQGSYPRGRSDEYDAIKIPETDIASSALPWGMLQPGTQMRGFIYFHRSQGTANGVNLAWHFAT